MIRLAETPQQYQGLSLASCGLLFLSTPHSGTDEGTWNDFLVELAKLSGAHHGRDFTKLLSAFNRESTDAKGRFGLLRPVPPFICVYETQRTLVKGLERVIVTPDSAGLNGQRAQPMSYADHRTICRFPHQNDSRFLQVLGWLDQIRRDLVEMRTAPRQQVLESEVDHVEVSVARAKGGDAQGGDSVSSDPGGSAQGGRAVGGKATALHGGRAVGGSAVGGDAMA
ncbi:hypothetical protein QBC38DRAFT_361571 [Podospora fimiseda]|uniref:Uncharacterized protein n=1 Tax=Podospora fimiseda TaxID=252190 RepID=A0AAN7BSE8_9PEZI|nr:hypothetical protein QBC38DRAFT_361571 [Podospora fimiseda]